MKNVSSKIIENRFTIARKPKSKLDDAATQTNSGLQKIRDEYTASKKASSVAKEDHFQLKDKIALPFFLLGTGLTFAATLAPIVAAVAFGPTTTSMFESIPVAALSLLSGGSVATLAGTALNWTSKMVCGPKKRAYLKADREYASSQERYKKALMEKIGDNPRTRKINERWEYRTRFGHHSSDPRSDKDKLIHEFESLL